MAAAASSSSLTSKEDVKKEMKNKKLEESIAVLSERIKRMMEDGCAGYEMLVKVVVFLEKQKKKIEEKQELIKWDEEFPKEFLKGDKKTHFGLLNAAHYLDAKCLMDVACQATADMIKDKPVEWVRDFFGIVNDFTPEEEAAIRAQNPWAYE